MRRAIMLAAGAVIGAAIATAAPAMSASYNDSAPGVGRLSPDLQSVRAATARYHDVANALADGYTNAGQECVSVPGLGAMGVHFVNYGLVGDDVVDPLRPEILLYQPESDGGWRFLGVEYMKVDADQDLATDDDRPSLFGTYAFHGPMLGHGPGMPIHYDLHVWTALNNPVGLMEDFNPSASCSA